MHATVALLLSTAFTIPGLPPANGPLAPPRDRTVLVVGNVSYEFPFRLPTANEIVAALPRRPEKLSNARIRCDLISIHQDAAKIYPFVGLARMQNLHFKCTVSSTGYREVVYFDHSRLVKVP